MAKVVEAFVLEVLVVDVVLMGATEVVFETVELGFVKVTEVLDGSLPELPCPHEKHPLEQSSLKKASTVAS